jgi:hypothetical protein
MEPLENPLGNFITIADFLPALLSSRKYDDLLRLLLLPPSYIYIYALSWSSDDSVAGCDCFLRTAIGRSGSEFSCPVLVEKGVECGRSFIPFPTPALIHPLGRA